MSAPAGLLAASTLLWGWFCELTLIAVPLALLLEAWRWIEARWDLSTKDFQRVADFCTWAFVLEAGYFIVAKGWPLPILLILQWLPLVLAPLMLAQLYSGGGRIELSALLLSLRADSAGALARERVDLSFAYVAVCVLAAGAANVRTPWYFVAAVALALWALWRVRSRRYPLWLWAGLAMIAVLAGHAGHQALSRLQTWIFNAAIEYFQLDLVRTDPYRAATDIGHIGELKSSDRILLRVAVPADVPMPLLLHRASYDVYAAATWRANNARFTEQVAHDGAGRWLLDRQNAARFALTVSETFPSGIGVLALPAGPLSVSGLERADLLRNRLGVVRVERRPGLASYTVQSAATATARDAPTDADLRVPAQESAALKQTVDALGLPSLDAAEAVATLKQFFAQRFRYSTFRNERVAAAQAISEFLLSSRSGHCEYFATATVLLARAAGIPARYATGFSVQEFSDIEGRYVVRERHAHAWARVHLNGAWHDVDTTPPEWFAAEARGASVWAPIADIGSWLSFRFSQWRARDTADESAPGWYVLLGVLFGVLVWRILRGGRFARARRERSNLRPQANAALESPWLGIERYIAKQGLPRLGTEAYGEWLQRIGSRYSEADRAALHALLRWHYREKFDPLGMEPADRRLFDQAAARWLAGNPAPCAVETPSVSTG